MNKERRKRIEDVIAKLQNLQEEVACIASDEREAFENLPEGLQYSERGEAMEENADNLESAYDSLDAVISDIQDVLDAN